MNNMFSNFTNGKGRGRRKRNKSYYIGLLMLFIICVIYLILYPELGNLPGSEDSSYEGGTIVSPEEFYGDGTGSGVVSPEEFYGSLDVNSGDSEESEHIVSPEEFYVSSGSETDFEYNFKHPDRLYSHYEKHGIGMGFVNENEYLAAANALIKNPEALHKTEAEDGDDIYYLEATNEIVFVSKEGYIRTYYICSGKDYFDRQ